MQWISEFVHFFWGRNFHTDNLAVIIEREWEREERRQRERERERKILLAESIKLDFVTCIPLWHIIRSILAETNDINESHGINKYWLAWTLEVGN